jgi:hypothetical protein
MPSESGLLSLLRRCHLTRREQRVMAVVLGANTPMTARAVAELTRLHYSHTKTVVRGLVAWSLLERTPDGLRFQPDPAWWGPPKDVALKPRGKGATGGGMAASQPRMPSRSRRAAAETGPISVPGMEGHGEEEVEQRPEARC